MPKAKRPKRSYERSNGRNAIRLYLTEEEERSLRERAAKASASEGKGIGPGAFAARLVREGLRGGAASSIHPVEGMERAEIVNG